MSKISHYSGFINWLSSRRESEEVIRGYLTDIETVGSFYSKHQTGFLGIWEISNPQMIDNIINLLKYFISHI